MTITYMYYTGTMEMLDYHWLKLNVGTRRGGKLVGESERGIHLGHDVQNSKIDCECRVLNWLDRTVVSLRHNPNPICREWVVF